ncbi:hypothetical protein AAH178_002862 [Serratia marcescens]
MTTIEMIKNLAQRNSVVASADVLAVFTELEASKKSNAFLKEQLAKLANFNPDWDMLEACRESWREVAAALKEAEGRLVAKDKRIAELEADELALIDERDSAEDIIAEMYEAATGNRPQWSSCFRFSDAVEDVAQVRARLTTPMRLPAAKDTSQGWTIDPDYLSAIAEKVGHSEDEGSPSMVTVEAVLLATGFTVGDETASVATAEGQLVTAMGYQGGRHS